jgi:hypothetical protein
MTRQVNFGSLWPRRLDDCGPLDSARLKSGQRRYCNRNLLPGRVRGWGCVIVAWVGIPDIRSTDQK